MRKRILSMLLAAILVVGMLPAAAFAAGDINRDGSVDGSDMQRLYSHLNKSNPLF